MRLGVGGTQIQKALQVVGRVGHERNIVGIQEGSDRDGALAWTTFCTQQRRKLVDEHRVKQRAEHGTLQKTRSVMERGGLSTENNDARHVVVEQRLQHADQRRGDGARAELVPQQRTMDRVVGRANVEESEMRPGTK
jgi:hypothetical protein